MAAIAAAWLIANLAGCTRPHAVRAGRAGFVMTAGLCLATSFGPLSPRDVEMVSGFANPKARDVRLHPVSVALRRLIPVLGPRWKAEVDGDVTEVSPGDAGPVETGIRAHALVWFDRGRCDQRNRVYWLGQDVASGMESPDPGVAGHSGMPVVGTTIRMAMLPYRDAGHLLAALVVGSAAWCVSWCAVAIAVRRTNAGSAMRTGFGNPPLKEDGRRGAPNGVPRARDELGRKPDGQPRRDAGPVEAVRRAPAAEVEDDGRDDHGQAKGDEVGVDVRGEAGPDPKRRGPAAEEVDIGRGGPGRQDDGRPGEHEEDANPGAAEPATKGQGEPQRRQPAEPPADGLVDRVEEARRVGDLEDHEERRRVGPAVRPEAIAVPRDPVKRRDGRPVRQRRREPERQEPAPRGRLRPRPLAPPSAQEHEAGARQEGAEHRPHDGVGRVAHRAESRVERRVRGAAGRDPDRARGRPREDVADPQSGPSSNT